VRDSRLPGLADPPMPDEKTVGPHAYRMLGDAVLVTGISGRWAMLSEEEYRTFAEGMAQDHPRWDELREKGLVRNFIGFEQISGEMLDTSLLAWPGPRVVIANVDGMEVETARRVIDFIFTVPGPVVHLEIVTEDLKESWPVVWFLLEYGRKRSEWNGRLLRLWLRIPPSSPSSGIRKTLLAHKVGIRIDWGEAKSPRSQQRSICERRLKGRS